MNMNAQSMKSFWSLATNVAFACLFLALAGEPSLGGYIPYIARTSFEDEPIVSTPPPFYVDTGNPAVDHDLVNNPGQPVVDSTSLSFDLGFDASYVNTRNSAGLSDGDDVGVTDLPPETPGHSESFAHGNQGYWMSDPDGLIMLTFEQVDLSDYSGVTVSLDLYLGRTTWDNEDAVVALVETDAGDILLFDTTGIDIDTLGVEGTWMPLTKAIPNAATTATLKVMLDSNAHDEEIYIDDIFFSGFTVVTPEPHSLVMFVLGAGLILMHRRRNVS